MKHVMIDLETLDSHSTAAITSIGAVFFDVDTNALGKEFKRNVSSRSSQKFGLTIDADTIEWWFKQTPEARAHLYDPLPITLDAALRDFTNFLRENGDVDAKGSPAVYVWGNGATFDNVILRYAYEKVGQSAPWSFRYDSCFRTLKNQFDPTSKFWQESRVGVAHDSLSDAKSQAQHALAIFNSIKVVTEA
jgi:hypothetical protein